MTETIDVTVVCPVTQPEPCRFQVVHHYSKEIADRVGITAEDGQAKKHARDHMRKQHEAGKHAIHGIRAFTGQMIRKDAEVIMIFKANGKYYPANQNNCEVMDGYLHTGAIAFLDQLTDEVEL